MKVMGLKRIVETIDESDKRVDYLKFVNTFGIAVVIAIAGYTRSDVQDVKTEVKTVREVQAVQAIELMRIKTLQDINTANIGNIHNRVYDLEINRAEQTKKWTEDNFKKK